MAALNKTDMDFVGAATSVDWVGVANPRPGSAGTQAVRVNTDTVHTLPSNILSQIVPKASAVANVLDSHIEYWTSPVVGGTGGGAGEAAFPLPIFRVTTPGASGITPGGLNAAGLLSGNSVVGFLGNFGVGPSRLALYASPPANAGYYRFRANSSGLAGGHRSHQEVWHAGLSSWMLLADVADFTMGVLAAGRTGFLLFGDSSVGQFVDLDDVTHTETTDFPSLAHVGEGVQVTEGFETAAWPRGISIEGQTTLLPATLPSAVAGARPGSGGTGKLSVTLEGATFRSFLAPRLVLRPVGQNKDREIEVWVEVPTLPASGSLAATAAFVKHGFNTPANDAPDIGVEFRWFASGTVTVNRFVGASNFGDAGEGIITTVAPGDWLGMRLRFKQFGRTAPAMDVSWNLNNGGWNLLPLLSAAAIDSVYIINAVNQGTKTFTFTSAIPEAFPVGKTFTVAGSTGNNGMYTVDSVAAVGADLNVTVVEAIPDPTADGNATLPDFRLLDIAVLGRVLLDAVSATGGPFVFGLDDYQEQEF